MNCLRLVYNKSFFFTHSVKYFPWLVLKVKEEITQIIVLCGCTKFLDTRPYFVATVAMDFYYNCIQYRVSFAQKMVAGRVRGPLRGPQPVRTARLPPASPNYILHCELLLNHSLLLLSVIQSVTNNLQPYVSWLS